MDTAPVLSLTTRRDLWAVGTALAAGAAVSLVTIDPATARWFPGCSIRAATGWWCPGCGLTRGVHRLARGDLLGALDLNVLTPAVVVMVAAAWLWWGAAALTRRPWRPRLARLTVRRMTAISVVTVVVFTVARNLPPFAVLAP